MKRTYTTLIAAALAVALAGCSAPNQTSNSSAASNSSEQSSAASSSIKDSQNDSDAQASDSETPGTPVENDESAESDSQNPLANIHLPEGTGKRVRLTLDQAVTKKNNDEQFVLLYMKDDCSYCAEFDQVLNPFINEHPLTVYEVSLSQAEEMYMPEDKDTMLNILTAGVGRTPALYYIESQEKVNLLDHTAENYSTSGLTQWVAKYDLTSLK